MRPLHDNIFIVALPLPDTTASGLHLPETATNRGHEYRVLSRGPGRKHARTGELIPTTVHMDDIVVLPRHVAQANEIQIPLTARVLWGITEHERVYVVRESDVLAVVSREA